MGELTRLLGLALVLTTGLPVEVSQSGSIAADQAILLDDTSGGMRLGISYYAALGFDAEVVVKPEICELLDHDYVIIRLFATWSGGYADAQFANCAGTPRIDQRNRLVSLFKYARDRNFVIDVSFDIREYVNKCGSLTYSQYREAVRQVAVLARDNGASGKVIIDVCNECIVADRVDAIDSTDVKPERRWDFTHLDKFPKDVEGSIGRDLDGNKILTVQAALVDLIETVQSVQADQTTSPGAFFSVMPSGTKTDDEISANYAVYYTSVYSHRRVKDGNKLYVAPHFKRTPCIPLGNSNDNWAELTGSRIQKMKNGLAGIPAYRVYIQEENRRYYSCFADSPDPLRSACKRNYPGVGQTDITYQDFVVSAKQSQIKDAWGWVFHTDLGFGCYRDAKSNPYSLWSMIQNPRSRDGLFVECKVVQQLPTEVAHVNHANCTDFPELTCTW